MRRTAAQLEDVFGREPTEGEPYDWRTAGCRGAAEHEVLGYQAWTYWVFRKRITTHHIPEPVALTR